MKINIFKSTLLIISAFCFTSPSFATDTTNKNMQNLEQKANQGLAEDQYNLAKLYETDRQYRNQDYFKAVEWYTKAANQGLAKAQYNLGQLYEKSQGVPQDYAKAVEWYTKAANQGLVNAQYNLGQLYEKNHQNLPQDYVKAVEWYTKAANQGLVNAQYNLGQLYEKNHQNLPQDYVKAVEWYTKAANQKMVLNRDNITSYDMPKNSYYRLESLLSSADFKKSQDIPKIKEFFKQDCLNKHQNSCDFYKKLND